MNKSTTSNLPLLQSHDSDKVSFRRRSSGIFQVFQVFLEATYCYRSQRCRTMELQPYCTSAPRVNETLTNEFLTHDP